MVELSKESKREVTEEMIAFQREVRHAVAGNSKSWRRLVVKYNLKIKKVEKL